MVNTLIETYSPEIQTFLREIEKSFLQVLVQLSMLPASLLIFRRCRRLSKTRGLAIWCCIVASLCMSSLLRKMVSTGDLRSGNTQSCGCSKLSHGEMKIKSLLEEYNIPFE